VKPTNKQCLDLSPTGPFSVGCIVFTDNKIGPLLGTTHRYAEETEKKLKEFSVSGAYCKVQNKFKTVL
jgi:hypothetical protein